MPESKKHRSSYKRDLRLGSVFRHKKHGFEIEVINIHRKDRTAKVVNLTNGEVFHVLFRVLRSDYDPA